MSVEVHSKLVRIADAYFTCEQCDREHHYTDTDALYDTHRPYSLERRPVFVIVDCD